MFIFCLYFFAAEGCGRVRLAQALYVACEPLQRSCHFSLAHFQWPPILDVCEYTVIPTGTLLLHRHEAKMHPDEEEDGGELLKCLV